ncbi:hypothetical protein AKJ50_01790 [candidate division MSBL1 archaeon SCGC-AAA382A13]|uniref:Uncharacterized protein n=2 Tax=candidate division MSBL1 TaxID=215777 RepID=A0A133VH21_9EURY|nr:hypothetical protein AKJ50_01790 [candidate division MSBL1 archaeon SCGC-AAA382A13]KXB05710.1 hypothetical protein AKJ49_00310 [candidate division MSBL1 archaeon SCGC-AAA382A03]
MPDPYMYGETSGRKKATELRAEALGNMLNSAENVLFVLGSELGEYPENTLKEIISKIEATVYKTEAAGAEDFDIEAEVRLGLMEIVQRLCDYLAEEFDYIIFVGIPYHIETRVLSGLRSYDVKTVVTLNWRHQQYADFSFKNISEKDEWKKELKTHF